jgi:hypothetical protein
MRGSRLHAGFAGGPWIGLEIELSRGHEKVYVGPIGGNCALGEGLLWALGEVLTCLGVSVSFARQLALFAILGLTMALDSPPPRCSNEVGSVYYAVSVQVRASIRARGASPSGGEASKPHCRPLPALQAQPIAARKCRSQYVHEANSRKGELGMSYCLGESVSFALCGVAGILRELVMLGCASSCQSQRAPLG